MKDFELLKQIKAIQLEHPEKGYRKRYGEKSKGKEKRQQRNKSDV